jgi:hypothetical protein
MTARSMTIVAILTVLQFGTVRAEPPSAVRAEVEHLLESIETSGCTFLRNGSWYSGSQAKAHLLSKYDYLAARDLIMTTEDFIDKGATKSSLSGLPYKIRCGNDAAVETRQWLRAALARYRGSVKAAPDG